MFPSSFKRMHPYSLGIFVFARVYPVSVFSKFSEISSKTDVGECFGVIIPVSVISIPIPKAFITRSIVAIIADTNEKLKNIFIVVLFIFRHPLITKSFYRNNMTGSRRTFLNFFTQPANVYH